MSRVQLRFKNRNNLTMDYLLGGKTGTTENAGLCLASIASQNNSNYMLITTKAPQNGSTPNHLLDAKTIYEYFINHYETKNVLEKEEQILSLPTKDSNQKEIKFYANEEVNKYLPKEFQKDMLEYHYDGKQEITPDMQAGTKLGTVTIDFQREHLANIEIILNESIPFDLITYFQNRPYIIGLILLIIILGIIMMIRIVRKKKIMLKK